MGSRKGHRAQLDAELADFRARGEIAVRTAREAKQRFEGLLKATSPALVEAFQTFLEGYAAPRRFIAEENEKVLPSWRFCAHLTRALEKSTPAS